MSCDQIADIDYEIAGSFDELLKHMGLPPSPVHFKIINRHHHHSFDNESRNRRMFNGDFRYMDMKMVYGWVDELKEVQKQVDAGICDSVVDKYEERVRKFGYSLRDFYWVHETSFLRSFPLVPQGHY